MREGGTGSGGDVRNLGKPVSLAERYFREGADEISFLNITGFRDFPLEDLPMLEVFIASTSGHPSLSTLEHMPCDTLMTSRTTLKLSIRLLTIFTMLAAQARWARCAPGPAGAKASVGGHFRAADGGRRHPLLHRRQWHSVQRPGGRLRVLQVCGTWSGESGVAGTTLCNHLLAAAGKGF